MKKVLPIQNDVHHEEEREKPNLYTEFKLKLNPVQLYAIQETILQPDFIASMNEVVENIDNGIDDSFWGKELYTGDYAGTLEYLESNTKNEAAMKKNIPAVIINLFMLNILKGPERLFESPDLMDDIKNILLESEDTDSE